MVKGMLSPLTQYDTPGTQLKFRCRLPLFNRKASQSQPRTQDHLSARSKTPFLLQNASFNNKLVSRPNSGSADDSLSLECYQLTNLTHCNNRRSPEPTPKLTFLESNIRQDIFDNCQKLCQDWSFTKQTFFLSAAYIDLIAEDYSLLSANKSLLSLVCVYLAAKIHEKRQKVPKLTEFITSFPERFELGDFYACETSVVHLLSFNMNIKTPYVWFANLINHTEENCWKFACVCNQTELDLRRLQKMNGKLKRLSLLLIYLCLKFWDFRRFDAKTIAQACIVTVIDFNGRESANKIPRLLPVRSLQECTRFIDRRLKIRKMNSFKGSRKTSAISNLPRHRKNLIRDSFSTCDNVRGKIDCNRWSTKEAEGSASVESTELNFDFSENELELPRENITKFGALLAKVINNDV